MRPIDRSSTRAREHSGALLTPRTVDDHSQDTGDPDIVGDARQQRPGSIPPHDVLGIAPRRLLSLLADIEGGFAERRSSAQLASAHGLTAGMCRSFRVATGRTIHEYRTLIRVVAGVRSLALTDEKVSAVASSVGYPSKKDFYRVLERYVGALPKEIRALTAAERILVADIIADRLLSPAAGAARRAHDSRSVYGHRCG